MLAKLADSSELRALAIASAVSATARQIANPFEAEILPNCRARWHVVATHPDRENKASMHLVARRFGIYIPEFDQTEIVRGKVHHRHLRMFPGYIFIFVWGIMAHWRRIMACPGVARIMLDGDWPATVPDRFIEEIQQVEFEELMNGPANPLHRISRSMRKGWRAQGLTAVEMQERQYGSGIVEMSTKSYWRELPTLDGDGRNRLLHKALGLAL
jgi:transcription antitermination factor NusG